MMRLRREPCSGCPARVFLGAALLLSGVAVAEDTVIYSTGKGTEDRTRKTGEILDYTGQELRLRQANGRELSIETPRVIRVTTPLTKRHKEAKQLYAQREFQRASTMYGLAIRDESCTWVRRQLLARQIWCQRALQQHTAAIDGFLLLMRSDPHSQYSDSIPLPWTNGLPDPTLQRRAEGLLREKEPAWAPLLGASWLLPTEKRAAAITTLQRLAEHREERVAMLAEAQLWRTQVVTANKADVDRWRQTYERIPADLRAGPSYVLGQALARQQAHEEAALYYMRVPIHFPFHRQLVMESLFSAARQLEAIDQHPEAATLYGEVITEFPDSPRAPQAKQRLSTLAEQPETFD